MIVNLEKRVDTWVELGVIDRGQGTRILELEQSQPSRPWVIYGISAIGVTAIVTGVISLVAANWVDIPDFIKLLSYFILQSVVGYLAIRLSSASKETWREMAIFAFAMLLFAGIGLVSQVFHLHSESWKGFAFWVVLTLPVVLAARSALVNHIWVMTTMSTAVMWATERAFYRLGESEWFYRACVVASVPLVLLGLGFLLEKFSHFKVRYFQRAVSFWGFGICLFAGTIVGNCLWEGMKNIAGQEAFHYLLIPWIFNVIAIIANYGRFNVPRVQRNATFLMLLAAGIYLTMPIMGFQLGMDKWSRELIGALGFIVIWSLAATSAALANYKKLFDLASLIIAIRFIVVYFQVFGSLTTTGFGLIVSGLVILAVAFLWYRYRANVSLVLNSGGAK